MGALSSADKNRLRNEHPHIVSVNLSVMIPEIVYVGTVNLAGSGYAYIKVNDVSGTITDLEAGQTLYIGDSSGDASHGKRRFRYLTGDDNDILFLDENGMDWEDGWYVTAYKNWELWPKFPYIASTTRDDNTTKFLFYKDFNIPYQNQNNKIAPVALMGSHRAGWLESSSISFSLDGSDSHVMTPSATISSYLWECDDGTIDSPTSSTTTITFTSTGIYWVKLTVMDSNGKYQETYRAFFVHDEDDMPYVDFNLRSPLTGSWRQGGWNLNLQVMGDADVDNFPEGALVVLWTDQYFDGEEVSVGDNGNILFAGYIDDESVSKELDTGHVQFSASTINQLLDQIQMNSVSITAVDSGDTPSSWTQFRHELTVARAVHHYWKWHSTLLEICDVILPVSNTYEMIAQDFEEGTLYNVIDTFTMEHGIFAHVCCAKHGRLHVEEDVQMLNDTDRGTVATVMEIKEEDRRGETDIELVRNTQFRTHYATVTGVSGDGTPYGSQAMSDVYEARGNHLVAFERCVVNSQAHANELAGRVFGVANLKTLEVRIPLAGNYHGVTPIVPQEWFTLTLAAADTKRGVVWTDEKLVVRDVRLDIDVVAGVIEEEVILEPEADTYPSQLLDVSGGEPYNIPLPPFPTLPPWAFNFPSAPFPFAEYLGEPVRNIRDNYWANHTLENAASGIRIEDENVTVVDCTDSSMGYTAYRGILYDGYYFYFTATEGGLASGQGQLWRVAPDGTTTKVEIADGTSTEAIAGNPILFAVGVVGYIWEDRSGGLGDYKWEIRTMDFNVADDKTGIETLLDFDEIEVTNHYNELLAVAGAAYGDFDYFIVPTLQIEQSGVNSICEEITFRIYNYQEAEAAEVTVDIDDVTIPNANLDVMSEVSVFDDKVIYIISIVNTGTTPRASQNYVHILDLATLTISSTKVDAYLDQEGYFYNIVPDFENDRVYYVNKDEDSPDGGAGRCYFDLTTEAETEVGGDEDTDYIASRDTVYYKVDGSSTVYRIGVAGNVDIIEDDFNDGICRQVDEVEARIWRLDVTNEKLIGYDISGGTREINLSGTDLFPLPVSEATLGYYLNLIGDKFLIMYRYVDAGGNQTEFYIVKPS